jgi:uncharacterized membrane protein
VFKRMHIIKNRMSLNIAAMAAVSAFSLVGGLTIQVKAQEERPPLSEEDRRKVLERLTQQLQAEQAKQAGKAVPQQPQPAPPPKPTTAPAAQPAVPGVVQRAPATGGPIQLSYDNADLYEFINQIASTLAITPIVIDPEVKGTVTIHSSAPMSREDIFPLFNLILKNNNAALVKQGNVYQIVPISSGLKKGLDIIEHLPPEAERKPEATPAAAPESPQTPGAISGPAEPPRETPPNVIMTPFGAVPRPPATGAVPRTRASSSGNCRPNIRSSRCSPGCSNGTICRIGHACDPRRICARA